VRLLFWCVLFIVSPPFCSFASDDKDTASTNIFVLLVEVSHSPNEVLFLVAKFVPIHLDDRAGGGKAAGTFPPPAAETVIGEEFTLAFRKPVFGPHEQTLLHVIDSCASKSGANTGILKLLLVLSVSPRQPSSSAAMATGILASGLSSRLIRFKDRATQANLLGKLSQAHL
jgi:hypothetical protein